MYVLQPDGEQLLPTFAYHPQEVLRQVEGPMI